MTDDAPSENAARGTVVLADDHDDSRGAYIHFLERRGWRIFEARTGDEVVPLVLRVQPSIVVLDLSLPVVDGWALARQLKGNVRTARIPLLALSGHVLGRARASALEAGCDDFLAKPCLPSDLEREVERMIRRGRWSGSGGD